MTKPATRLQRHAEQQARAHPVAWLLRRVAREARSVQAPATVWLLCLNQVADERARSSRQWPKSPEQLARTFGELSEGLALLGVVLTPYRGRINGQFWRVWRLDTRAAHRQQGNKWRGTRLLPSPGQPPENRSFSSDLLRLTSVKAENRSISSAVHGQKPMGRTRQRTPVEECRRITPHEAAHVGAQTETAPVAGTSAHRLWLLCPQCGERKRFLYERPDDAELWKCFECHRLTTRKRQQKGTRVAFEQWLTPRRWGRMSRQHPALEELYEAMATDWKEKVAPFDMSRLEESARVALLAEQGAASVTRTFEHRRQDWSRRWEPQIAQVGEMIALDLWEWWKKRNRSNAKAKSPQ